MYWIILAFVIYGILKYDFGVLQVNSKGRDWLYFIVLILVIFVSAFAFSLGTDGPKYQDSFEYDIPTLSHLSRIFINSYKARWQPGFILMMSLCKTINPSFYFFKLVYATVLNISIFTFFRRNTNYLFMAILYYLMLYGLYFNFEIFREAMALTVFIWAYPLINQKKWAKYYLLCIVAIMFHTSALILFFVPLISLLKVGNMTTTMIMFFATIVLIVISSQTTSIIARLLSYSEDLDSNYAYYFDQSRLNKNAFSLTKLGVWFALIVDVFLPLIMLYILPRQHGTKDYYPLIFIVTLLVVPSRSYVVLFRFGNYFAVFKILFYLEMFDYIVSTISNRKWNYLIFALVCFIYVGYFFQQDNLRENEWGVKGIDRYYPYTSIMDKNMSTIRE